MSNTSSDQSLSLSAAGRNIQLGMVYDANTDKLFESINVLNKCPSVGKKSRLCPSQILDLKSSYTIDERMEVFQFDGHMKVGVAFGFRQLGSASGKYVNDMSSSIEQSRMTLQYKQTKRYEELDTATVLKLCDNLDLLKMAREHEATHFVAGMTYGNQVLMDFKCTKQRDAKNDLLDIQLKGIFRIGQFFADKFNKDNERIITFDDIQCEIFCESKDIKKNTSFDEAKQIYRDLPTTLENVEVVDCVHLLPLSVIDEDAKKFNKSDIDEVVMKKLVHIRDGLYEQEMRCDDFGKGNINVSKIKACIQKHTEEMKQSLSSNTPKDWNREIIKHNSSDFERTKLSKRIKEESRPKTVSVTPRTERSQYKCGRCDIPFDTQNELSKHEKTHEKRNRVRRTCPTCDIEFSEGSEFDKHMGTHEVRRTCPTCDIEFSEGSEFDKHMGTHEVRRTCPTCDIEFSEGIRRTCPTCDIEFSEGSEFVKHMGTHEERRQYKCGRCDIPFDTQNELLDHEKTHDIRNRDQVSDDSNSGSNSMESVVVGAATGAASGATYGAMAGAVLGPVGVAVGGTVGAVIGGTVGAGVGAGVRKIYSFFQRLRGK